MSGQKYNSRRDQKSLDLIYGHLMSQAPEVEKAVLGALMIDKNALFEVGDLLKPESFYEPRNQLVYEAIQQLCREDSPVDMLTVTDKLGKMGKLDEVGGPVYVADLSSSVVSSANISYHVNVVAEKYLSRQMIQYVNTIGKKSFDETYDIREVMQEAESMLLELTQNSMKKDYTALAPVVEKAVKAVELAYSNKGILTGIPSGFTVSGIHLSLDGEHHDAGEGGSGQGDGHAREARALLWPPYRRAVYLHATLSGMDGKRHVQG